MTARRNATNIAIVATSFLALMMLVNSCAQVSMPSPTLTAPRSTVTVSSTTTFVSPSGRYSAHQEAGDSKSCNATGRAVHIVDTRTLYTIQDFPGATFAQWLSDNTAEIRTTGCEQGQSYSVNVETGMRRELGALGIRLSSPDGQAFAEYVRSDAGLGSEFWLYDVVRQAVIRLRETHRRYDTLCWTPSGSHLIFTSQVMSNTNSSSTTIGPRQVWIVDKQDGQERMLLGDNGQNYFIASGSPEQWRCVWQDDWLQVQVVPYIVTSLPTEPSEKDWDALACLVYGQTCKPTRSLGLNWRTGKVALWDEVPSR